MKNLIFVVFLVITGCTTIQDSNIKTVYQNPQFVSTPNVNWVSGPPVTSYVAPTFYTWPAWGGWGWNGWGWNGWGWRGCW